MTSLINNPENQTKSNGRRGGYRKNAGRPKGSMSEARKAQLKAEAALKVQVLNTEISLREKAAQHAVEAIEELVRIFKDEATPAAAKVSAIKELLDRGHGKPPQALTGEGGGPIQSETVIKQVIVDPLEYDA